jgi:hypothetical protein
LQSVTPPLGVYIQTDSFRLRPRTHSTHSNIAAIPHATDHAILSLRCFMPAF